MSFRSAAATALALALPFALAACSRHVEHVDGSVTSCDTDALRCNGTVIETCGESRVWEPARDCADARLVCRLAACACATEGARACNGNAIEVCESAAWTPVQTCGAGMSCGAGACAASLTDAGTDGGRDAGFVDGGGHDGGGDAGGFDAATPDAGLLNSGAPDAAFLDGGARDGGAPDAGLRDAGTGGDGGAADAGAHDGGDAGTAPGGPAPTFRTELDDPELAELGFRGVTRDVVHVDAGRTWVSGALHWPHAAIYSRAPEASMRDARVSASVVFEIAYTANATVFARMRVEARGSDEPGMPQLLFAYGATFIPYTGDLALTRYSDADTFNFDDAAALSAGQIVVGHEYLIDFSVTGTSPVMLEASVFDTTAGGAAVAHTIALDDEAADHALTSAGAVGFGAGDNNETRVGFDWLEAHDLAAHPSVPALDTTGPVLARVERTSDPSALELVFREVRSPPMRGTLASGEIAIDAAGVPVEIDRAVWVGSTRLRLRSPDVLPGGALSVAFPQGTAPSLTDAVRNAATAAATTNESPIDTTAPVLVSARLLEPGLIDATFDDASPPLLVPWADGRLFGGLGSGGFLVTSERVGQISIDRVAPRSRQPLHVRLFVDSSFVPQEGDQLMIAQVESDVVTISDAAGNRPTGHVVSLGAAPPALVEPFDGTALDAAWLGARAIWSVSGGTALGAELSPDGGSDRTRLLVRTPAGGALADGTIHADFSVASSDVSALIGFAVCGRVSAPGAATRTAVCGGVFEDDAGHPTFGAWVLGGTDRNYCIGAFDLSERPYSFPPDLTHSIYLQLDGDEVRAMLYVPVGLDPSLIPQDGVVGEPGQREFFYVDSQLDIGCERTVPATRAGGVAFTRGDRAVTVYDLEVDESPCVMAPNAPPAPGYPACRAE